MPKFPPPRRKTLSEPVSVRAIKRVGAPPRPTGTVPLSMRSVRKARAAASEPPTCLLVGTDSALSAALPAALARHGLYVETCGVPDVIATATAAAPDLLVLMGDATLDAGQTVLHQLARSRVCAVIPVILLSDTQDLSERLSAFRHGAAAVIQRSFSIDAIAERVATLAKEIPERAGAALGQVGEATLHDLVDTLGKELRSGILSVQGSSEDDEPIRLVLDRGRPLAGIIDDFVRRVRKHVVSAEPFHYEFDERAAGSLELLGPGSSSSADTMLEGLRVVLADDDVARVDSVARTLRSHGIDVLVTDLEPSDARLQNIRSQDPTVLMMSKHHVEGAGYGLVRLFRSDQRLRWTSLLIVDWDEVWSEDASLQASRSMLGMLATITEPERNLQKLLHHPDPFEFRVETLGPARLLRAVAKSGASVRVSISNPRFSIDIDFAETSVLGATGQGLEFEGTVEGAAALSALLVLSTGRAHIEASDSRLANLMATVDVALDLAAKERPPIPPSELPPPLSSRPAPAGGQPAPGGAQLPDVPRHRIRSTPDGGRTSSPALAPPALAPSAPTPAGEGRPPATSFAPGGFPGTRTSAPDTHAQEASAPEATRPSEPEQPVPAQAAAAPLPAELLMTPPDVTAPGVSTDDAPPPPTAGRRAPAPTRIQRRTVATAVVASGFAVLAVVVIGIWLSRSGKRAATAPEVAAKADVSAAPKQQPSTGVTAQPQPSVAPVASASAAPEAEPDTDAAPTEPQTKETLFGQKNVESCETLLTGVAVDSLIGGAHHQYKVARRGIVSGNLKSAQRAYCAAEKLAPMDSKSWAGVAGILIMRGDGAKAAVHAKKAVDLNPDEPSHRYVLADALTLAERPAEAKAELVALAGASTKDKALADRFAGQGQLAARAGDCNRAERLFRRALAVTRQRADAAAGLARCYLTRRAFPVAIEWARRATQWDSRKSDYQVLLGDALAASGAKAEARSAWTKALELNPRDSNAKLRIDRGA